MPDYPLGGGRIEDVFVQDEPPGDVALRPLVELQRDLVRRQVALEHLKAQYQAAVSIETQQSDLRLERQRLAATLARDLSLGQYLRLGRGEEATGGRSRDLLLARAMEAVIGAVYLDGGMRAARAFLEPRLTSALTLIRSRGQLKDDKSLLQEAAQAQLSLTPTYRLAAETGPSHDRTFVVEVLLGDRVVGRGEGASKRQAEQAAARMALADDGWDIS